MKKYYDYSVKDLLTGYFSENAILKMRVTRDEPTKDKKTALALAWAYADREAVHRFLSEWFLEKTVLFDDYIAYFVRRGSEKLVYLCFMQFKEKFPFDLDPAYAVELAEEWGQKGYQAVFLRNCVFATKSEDGEIRSDPLYDLSKGVEFFRPVFAGGKYIFRIEQEPFWDHVTALFYDAVTKKSAWDFECLLSADAQLIHCGNARGEIAYESGKQLAGGISDIMKYFGKKEDFRLAYIKRKNETAFHVSIIAQNMKYQLCDGFPTQISKIIERKIRSDETVIDVPEEQWPKRFPMPKLTAVRALDVAQMYAYAIQTTYEDGCVKNYYLYSWDQPTIPESITVDGVSFDETILRSVRLTEGEAPGVTFSNGYTLPAHILYYRGISQMKPGKIPGVLSDNGTVRVEGRYRIPLEQYFVLTHQNFPRPDECYGVGNTLLDSNGDRLTDCSGRAFDYESFYMPPLIRAEVETNEKVGYLKPDGTWAVPPILNEAEPLYKDRCALAKIGEKQYLVNENGDMIPFDYEIDTDCYALGVCPFCAEKDSQTFVEPAKNSLSSVLPGLWGYVDKYGKIVIKPQYLFATSFGMFDCKRAFVARMVDGKPRWGMIDTTGREIIECKYPNLATHSSTAVNFQPEENGLYGIMDFDGNVIMEPRYRVICECSKEHGLIAAGNDSHHIGAVRMDDGKVIVPFLYDFVYFEEDYIKCGKPTGGEFYYDYDGNPLPAKIYMYRRIPGVGIVKRVDGKYGLVDEEGNIILPFIYDNPEYIDYYLEGFCLTGEEGRYGLTTKDGKRILEEKYTEISIEGDFIIAGKKVYFVENYSGELYFKDGTKVFEDLSRNIAIHDKTISRETPFGREYYQIGASQKKAPSRVKTEEN